MHTHEFKKHFVDFVPVDALMALMFATKGWNAAAEEVINEGVESGEIMVHDGKDISDDEGWARSKRRKLVTRLIFPINITKVAAYACYPAANLVVVDIPEGIESIGQAAFSGCRSLTTVSFRTTFNVNWRISLLQLPLSRKCRSPPHEPSRIRSTRLRTLLRTKIDDDPELTLDDWSKYLPPLLQASLLPHRR